jgi:ABC-type uncharacterized transport system permease subunit
MVGRCLRLWPIFSYVMPYFGFWLPGSVSLFSFLFHLRVFASLLSGVFSPLFMPERIGVRQAIR